MVIRQLVQAAVDIDRGRALADSGCLMIGQIVGRRQSRDTCFLQEVRVLLRVSLTLIQHICTSLLGPTVTQSEMQKIRHGATKFRAWLPTDMVRIVLPARLAEFELRSPEKQKGKTHNVLTDPLHHKSGPLQKQNKFVYDLTLSSGDEGTVPLGLSTAAGNAVASGSQLDSGRMKRIYKHGHRTKMTVLHTAAGEEVWDISSEEYSYSGSEGQDLIANE